MENILPLISIVIPTHNRADVLKECLDSVVNQTYKNFEVIVVNDNSKDETNSILEEYDNKYNNFNSYSNDGVGGNAARNFGVKMSKGEYIAFMDDDDVCELDRIDRQYNVILSNNKKPDFIISGFYIVSSNLKRLKTVDYKKRLDSVGFPQRWLIKKEVIIKSGCFDTEQPALQDVEFFWRLRDNASIIFDSSPVVSIRNSSISITKDKTKMINGINRLLLLHGDKMSKREKNIWLIQLCTNYASIANWNEYKVYLKKIEKNIHILSSVFLIGALLFKDYRILILHTRIKALFEKGFIKIS